MTTTQDALLAELRDIDGRLDQLFARRAWVVSQLPPPPGQPGPPGAHGPAPAAGGASVQQLLLTTGAILLGLAGLFFAAVAWALVGPAGRTGILLVLGAVLGAAAVLTRRRLAGAAGALAAVSASLVATAAYAGPALWEVTWSATGLAAWTTAVSVVLLAAWTGLAVLTSMRAWAVPATLAAAVGVVAAGLTAASALDDVLGYTAATAVLVVLVAALRPAVRVPAAWWTAVATAGGTSLLSLTAWLVEPERTVPYAVAVLGWAVVLLAARRLAPAAVPVVVARTGAAALVAAAAGLVVGAQPWGLPSLPLVAAGGVLVVLVALVHRVPAWPAKAAAGALGLGGVVVPTALGAEGTSGGWIAALLVVALATAVAGSAPRPGPANAGRAALWASAGTAAALAWGVQLADLGGLDELEWASLPVGALLTLAGGGWALSVRRYAGSWPSTAVSLLPGLLVGLLPGALASLTLTWGDGWTEPLVRSLVYTGAGAVLAVLGARLRVQALLLAGEVVLAVCALAHLGAAVQVVPQWVVLAGAGALLLGVGARWEWLRTRGGDAVGWVGSLR